MQSLKSHSNRTTPWRPVNIICDGKSLLFRTNSLILSAVSLLCRLGNSVESAYKQAFWSIEPSNLS